MEAPIGSRGKPHGRIIEPQAEPQAASPGPLSTLPPNWRQARPTYTIEPSNDPHSRPDRLVPEPQRQAAAYGDLLQLATPLPEDEYRGKIHDPEAHSALPRIPPAYTCDQSSVELTQDHPLMPIPEREA